MNYTIVEARRTHILPVAVAMRYDTPHPSGMPIRIALRIVFGLSAYRRAGLIDGHAVALWGITGSLLDDEGEAWIALSPVARARLFVVARESVNEMSAMLATKRIIRSSVLCRDARALRFAQWLGFKVEGDSTVNGIGFFQAVLRRA